jgi:ankyrin repeat protein
MRPSEWGYQEWGFEGEYGHRVLILDDSTRQQRTNEFVAAAGAGRKEEIERRLNQHQYIDTMHSKMQYTALHAAADFGHLEVVKVLVERGFHKFIDMIDGRWNQVRLRCSGQGAEQFTQCFRSHVS